MINLRTPRQQRLWYIAIAADGFRLAATDNDGLTLLDLATGSAVPVELGGEPDDSFAGVAFSPDNRVLAWLLRDVVILADRSGAIYRQLPAQPYPMHRGIGRLSFSPGGTELWAHRDRVYRWDAQTWAPQPPWPSGEQLGEYFVVAADGRTLALARHQVTGGRPVEFTVRTHFEYIVRFQDLRTGQDRAVIRMPKGTLGEPASAFSPDGRVFVCFHKSRLWAWEFATGGLLFTKPAGGSYFNALAFTPDGQFLLAAQGMTVDVYCTRTWNVRTSINWDVGRLTCLAVAPDGLKAAVGSVTGKIVVWDLDDA